MPDIDKVKEPIQPTTSKSKEMRTFVIVNPDGTESGGFKGHQPRQAALKVVNTQSGTKEKPITFRIRERGTKKVHTFSGYTEMAKSPPNKPKWIPDMVRKSFVKKISVEKIEKKSPE